MGISHLELLFGIFFFSPRFCKLFLHHLKSHRLLPALRERCCRLCAYKDALTTFFEDSACVFLEVVMPIRLLLFHPDVTAGILRALDSKSSIGKPTMGSNPIRSANSLDSSDAAF